MRVKMTAAASVILAAFFSIIGISVSDDGRASLSSSVTKVPEASNDTRKEISKVVSRFMGTFREVNTINEQPRLLVPSSVPVSSRVNTKDLPNRYQVVVSTYDDQVVTLGVIESKGSFALLSK